VSDYRAHLSRRLVECDVPANLHEGLVEYVAARRPVGGFLNAVLSNDLRGAIVRADPVTGRGLRQVVLFLNNYVPAPCWGSSSAVSAWLLDMDPAPEIFE
jgi:hypothetical protein